jgi:hypothetical protein
VRVELGSVKPWVGGLAAHAQMSSAQTAPPPTPSAVRRCCQAHDGGRGQAHPRREAVGPGAQLNADGLSKAVASTAKQSCLVGRPGHSVVAADETAGRCAVKKAEAIAGVDVSARSAEGAFVAIPIARSTKFRRPKQSRRARARTVRAAGSGAARRRAVDLNCIGWRCYGSWVGERRGLGCPVSWGQGAATGGAPAGGVDYLDAGAGQESAGRGSVEVDASGGDRSGRIGRRGVLLGVRNPRGPRAARRSVRG